MKMVFLLIATLLAQTGSALADRYLVKNPRATIAGINVVQSLKFGNETYVVVDVPRFSTLLSSVKRNADAVSEEAHIGLPGEESTSPSTSTAWHVKSLKYSELPAGRDGKDVVVAVLDTGVDYNHPNLKDHVFLNSKEIASNGIDEDGNGFIDDIHGWDFDEKTNNPMDRDEHGTHCAGVIAASPDATTGAQGIAPGVKILPIRIIGNERMGFLTNAAAGIKYAVDNGAKVLSNSWRVYKSWDSFDPSDVNLELLRTAIQYAADHGAIFVAASGNESLDMDNGFERDPLFPAGFTGLGNLVVVAASTESGAPAYFTNYGSRYVTVAAPGDNIISTVPGGRFESMSGTSMATPIVAGSIARGISAAFTSAMVVEKLVSTSFAADSWKTKVKAGGVIDLVKYLAD